MICGALLGVLIYARVLNPEHVTLEDFPELSTPMENLGNDK